jgi:CspA family cold shock protein
MAIGRIKWFSNEKGYGFIEAVESKQDVFVHFSDIVMEGYKTLKENAMVFFVLEQGAKGPGARHVCPLNEAETEGLANGVVGSDMPIPAQPIEIEQPVFEDPVYAHQADDRNKRRRARHPQHSEMA